MSAREALRPAGLFAAAMARAEAFLLEPAAPAPEPVTAPPSLRPVVVVAGLAPRCGATTVARALAAALAVRDLHGAAIVACEPASHPRALHTPAAGRLARVLGALSEQALAPAGHLCLADRADPARLVDAVRRLAPLVIEMSAGEPAGAAASLADHVVLVGAPSVEPALAEVVAASLARVGPPPVIVTNRARASASDSADRRPAVSVGGELPESRAAVRVARAGLVPRGAFGAAIGALADGLGPRP